MTVTPAYPEINLEFLIKRPLSYSSLKAFAKSPAHYREYLVAPKVTTPAFLIGGLVDVLLLTPDQYEERYIMKPVWDARTAEGKLIRDEFERACAEQPWLSPITPEIKDQADNIVHSIKTNSESAEMLTRMTQTQRKVEWVDKESGLPCVGIFDGDGDKLVVDLKTSASAQPDEFSRSAFNFGYPMQAAMYVDAKMRKTGQYPEFYYIVAEKEAPYGVSVCRATDEYIEYGRRQYKRLLMKFKMALDNKAFASSYEFHSVLGYYNIELPGWLRKAIQD
jgi:hypothetical protein